MSAHVVRLVLWNLADAVTTVDELRHELRAEPAEEPTEGSGLLFECWISDAAGERWGAVSVFDSAEAAEQPLPSRARELIGKDPEVAEVFDLEASVSVADRLSHLGLAFEER